MGKIATKLRPTLGKIGFGAIFMAAIPLLLILWANATSSMIDLPVPNIQAFNYLILFIGILFVFFGMLHLWIYGKGLPMNAYPPKHFVKNGVYAIVKNPIYLGTIIICFSITAIANSPSGFWLVSPLFTLMIIAYTVGFENEQIRKVFGPQDYRPFLSLPEKTNEELTISERISAYVLVFLPWFLVYEVFIFLGPPFDAIYTNFTFEGSFPVIEFTTVFYISTYLFAALVPWVLKTKKSLHGFSMEVWLATGISALLYFIFPFIVKQQDFVPETFLGHLLLLDRSYDGESAAFPAFHVIWAFIAARYFAISIKQLSWLWYVLAILMSISCITTGSHSILDVVAGLGVFLVVYHRIAIWNVTRWQSERLANSWREWNFGSVRLINHGFYAGAAGFIGVLLVGCFLGSTYAIAGFIAGVF
jgi:protein-S-isoprenylcysteine O-methyltransferase Ste14/membrane-associated phospholipid phosphatase